MSNWYVTGRILYTEEGEQESECYEFIVDARKDKTAREKAEKRAIDEFNNELKDDSMTDIHFVVDDCYETSDDARL